MSKLQKAADNLFKPAEKMFNSSLKPILDEPLVNVFVQWIVVLSIVYSADSLPREIRDVIEHPAMKITLTFLGVLTATKKFSSAVVLTLVVIGTFYALDAYRENFELASPTPNVLPGCTKVTVQDLLNTVKDKNEKLLRKVMYESGVPLNLGLNDKNAPLIATYLVNKGKFINDSCKIII